MKINRGEILKGSLVFLAVLVLGIGFSEVLIRKYETDIRKQFLTTTELVASAIGGDLTSNERLVAMEKNLKPTGVRWLYTMVRKDQTIVFQADSIPERTLGHTNPGQIYEKPPEELLTVFNNGKSQMAGPYTDEWGKFYSAFAVVRDSKNNRMLGVVGADINYWDYVTLVRGNQKYLITLTILLTILVLTGFNYFDRRLQSQDELKKSLSETQKEKAKLQALLTGIGEGVVACDKEGKVIFMNAAAEDMLDVKFGEIENKEVYEAWPVVNEKKQQIAKENRLIYLSLRSGHKYRTDPINKYYYAKKDGTLFPVEIVVSPIQMKGSIEGVILVFRDITEERRLEKMKDDFVSVASHELRTPMGAIKAYIDMMIKGDYGPVNKGLEDPLKDIATSADRLVSLVNDLLDLARLNSGRLNFATVNFDLNWLIDDTLAGLKPLVMQKGLSLEFDKKEAVSVKADMNRVRQVLINLIGNGLKFTQKGGVNITVNKEDKFARVNITDTGIGINKQDQDKLFKKFQQIENSLNDRPQGTGLGLFVSREMIQKMGGELNLLESTPEKGSTFTFTLPIV